MDRTVRIRNVVLQPRAITTYDTSIPDAGGSGYSQFQFEAATEKFAMYQRLSLSMLYNKPPPVWHHPLISSTLIRSEHIDKITFGTIHHSVLLLWSHLISQTADTQTQVFPQILAPQESVSLKMDDEKALSTFTYSNINHIQSALNKISAMWIDATAIAKCHPSSTKQPHCGPYVKRLTQRIDSLQRGESTVIPFTFRHLVQPVSAEDKPMCEEVQIFLVIEVIDEDLCDVTVCNTRLEGGVKYHSLSAAGNEGSMLYKPCITAPGVKLSLVNSQATWFSLYEVLFAPKGKRFSVVDFYFKFLPTLLGQSWDNVLLNSQKRDAEYSKAVLAAKTTMVGNDQARSLLLSPSFNKKHADSSLVPLIGYGTSSQLLHYTTQFLFKRVLGCSDHHSTKLFLAIKLRCLDMCYNDLSYVNILNKSERFHIETCIREVANYTTYCLEEYSNAANTVSIKDNSDKDEDKLHNLTHVFPTRELFVIYRGISRLKKELYSAKLISFSSEEQASLLLDDGGLSKQSQHSLFPFAERFVLARDKEVLLGSDVGSVVGFDLLDLPQGVRSYGDIIYVLRKARDIAITLRSQKTRFKNALLLARSFIFHVFSNIIPIPVSRNGLQSQVEDDVYSKPAS
jgi:hypothetical protein